MAMKTWSRHALMASVSALALAFPASAFADCVQPAVNGIVQSPAADACYLNQLSANQAGLGPALNINGVGNSVSLSNGAAAHVESAGQYAIELLGTGVSFLNRGWVGASGGIDISSYGAGTVGVDNQAGGTIRASGGNPAVSASANGSGAITVNNDGSIASQVDGVYMNANFRAGGPIAATNGGDITARGAAIKAVGGPRSVSVTNSLSGTLNGAWGISVTGLTASITNWGTATGTTQSVYAATTGAALTLDNRGTLNGNVSLQGANASLIMRPGALISGNVSLTRAAGQLGAAGTLLTMSGGTIDGSVSAGTISVTGASAIRGNISGSARFDADAQLTLGTLGRASNLTLPALATGASDGAGSVKLLQQASFAGRSFGAPGAGLRAVSIDGNASYAFSQTAGETWWVADTSIERGSTLSLPADPTMHGNLTVGGGTLDLGDSPLYLQPGPGGSQGNFSAASGSTVKTAIQGDGATSGPGATNLGRVIAAGSVSVGAGTVIQPRAAAGFSLGGVSDGARYILMSGGSPASIGAASVSPTPFVRWSLLRGDAVGQSPNDAYLVASRGGQQMAAQSQSQSQSQPQAPAEPAPAEASPSAAPAGAIIPDAVPSADPDFVHLLDPSAGAAILGRAADRAAGLSGKPLGGRKAAVWAAPFAFEYSQRGGDSAFRMHGSGSLAGADFRLADETEGGVFGGATRAGMAGQNATEGGRINMDSIGGGAWLSWSPGGGAWTLKGKGGLWLDSHSTSRQTRGGVATGKTSGEHFSADASVSRRFDLGDGWRLTPEFGMRAEGSRINRFTEDGADTFNASFKPISRFTAKARIGATIGSDGFDLWGGKLTPEIGFGASQQIMGRQPAVKASYSYGPEMEAPGAKLPRQSFDASLGLRWEGQGVSLSAGYFSEFSRKSQGQGVALRLKLKL